VRRVRTTTPLLPGLSLAMAKSAKHRLDNRSEVAIADQDDYAEHIEGYRHFVRGMQLVVVGVATVLLLLAFFLL
jgi:aa3 type cytochrome c oxidase subunit IV